MAYEKVERPKRMTLTVTDQVWEMVQEIWVRRPDLNGERAKMLSAGLGELLAKLRAIDSSDVLIPPPSQKKSSENQPSSINKSSTKTLPSPDEYINVDDSSTDDEYSDLVEEEYEL